jgi:4-carboxymuconolactone decarboxylase
MAIPKEDMRTHRKRFCARALLAASLLAAGCTPSSGEAAQGQLETSVGSPTTEDVRAVSPALAEFTDSTVMGEVWNRPGLSPRDRSVVTVSALIARDQASQLPTQVNRALDNGVTPGEISEIITHLAFYAGWPSALSAVTVEREVFADRAIGLDQLPAADGALLPLDEAAEAQRLSTNQERYGAVAPGVLEYTTVVLFRELWLRPALAPRDRSLVTVSALVATNQTAQLPSHLNRAVDNGLTRDETSEALVQLAFYAGWPKVFSALPVVREVFASRP